MKMAKLGLLAFSLIHVAPSFGAISIDDFWDIPKEFRKTYGYSVGFEFHWRSDTVNIYTYDFLGEKVINLHGGYARMPGITKDAYALGICHEYGHHFGGAPMMSRKKLSAEGQADYYAAAKCMKMFLADKDNVGYVEGLPEERTAFPASLCGEVYDDENDLAICIRTIIAAEDKNLTFWSKTKEEPIAPSVELVSQEVVDETAESHPRYQCRLDTAISGALCDIDPKIEASSTDPDVGYCTDGPGARPSCWYAP